MIAADIFANRRADGKIWGFFFEKIGCGFDESDTEHGAIASSFEPDEDLKKASIFLTGQANIRFSRETAPWIS